MNELKGCGGNVDGIEGDVVVVEEMDVEVVVLRLIMRDEFFFICIV